MWSLLVLILLAPRGHSSMFWSSNISLSEHDPYVIIGDNVTLNCSYKDNRNASDLYFQWKNYQGISTEYQRNLKDVLRLDMPIHGVDANDVNIYCMHDVDLDEAVTRLYVEYPLQDVDNVKVIVDNWMTLNVSWDMPPYLYLDRHVTLETIWTADGADRWYYCSDNSSTHCFLDREDYRDSTRYYFNITTNDTRADSTHTQSLEVDPDHYAKPSPVQLNWDPLNVTSRYMYLEWNLESTHKRGVNFTYNVTVIGEHTVVTELYTNFSDCGCSATVQGLRPYMKYTVQVTVKPRDRGYWSDPVTRTFTTLQEKPDRGPRVTEGQYESGDCDGNRRNVWVYLKPPKEEYQNGVLMGYRLHFIPSERGPVTNLTALKIDHFVVEELPCHIDYRVELTVIAELGVSPVTSLQVPAVDTVARARNVRLEKNSTGMRVLWESDDSPDNWTVFWCQQDSLTQCQNESSTKRVIFIILGEISWEVLNKSSARSYIPEKHLDNVRFGVSMTTDIGSSGIEWTQCTYDINNNPTKRPKLSSVTAHPNLALTTRWSLVPCDNSIYMTHYIVQWCNHGNKQCANSTLTSDIQELEIPELEEDVSYSVRIKEVAANGIEGPFSEALHATPTDNRLKPGTILGIVFGCLIILVFILAGVVQCFRFSRRKWKEREAIEHIHIPMTKEEDWRTMAFTGDTTDQQNTDSGRGTVSPLTKSQGREDQTELTNHVMMVGQLAYDHALIDLQTSGYSSQGQQNTTDEHNIWAGVSCDQGGEGIQNNAQDSSTGCFNDAFDEDNNDEHYIDDYSIAVVADNDDNDEDDYRIAVGGDEPCDSAQTGHSEEDSSDVKSEDLIQDMDSSIEKSIQVHGDTSHKCLTDPQGTSDIESQTHIKCQSDTEYTEDPQCSSYSKCSVDPECPSDSKCSVDPECPSDSKCSVDPECPSDSKCSVDPECPSDSTCSVDPELSFDSKCSVDPQCPSDSTCLVDLECPSYSKCLVDLECPSDSKGSVDPECPSDSKCLVDPECPSDSKCSVDPECPSDSKCSVDPECPSDSKCSVDPECPSDSKCSVDPELSFDSKCSIDPECPSDSKCLVDPECPSDSKCSVDSECLSYLESKCYVKCSTGPESAIEPECSRNLEQPVDAECYDPDQANMTPKEKCLQYVTMNESEEIDGKEIKDIRCQDSETGLHNSEKLSKVTFDISEPSKFEIHPQVIAQMLESLNDKTSDDAGQSQICHPEPVEVSKLSNQFPDANIEMSKIHPTTESETLRSEPQADSEKLKSDPEKLCQDMAAAGNNITDADEKDWKLNTEIFRQDSGISSIGPDTEKSYNDAVSPDLKFQDSKAQMKTFEYPNSDVKLVSTRL